MKKNNFLAKSFLGILILTSLFVSAKNVSKNPLAKHPQSKKRIIKKANTLYSTVSYSNLLNNSKSVSSVKAVSEISDIMGTVDISSHKNVVRVFPNPTTDVISINTDGQNLYAVAIYSMDGKLVNNTVTNTGSNLKINVASLAKGMYTVTVVTKDGKKYSQKLIKK